jgi:glycosyltransferase involved in cell wall biosynthesis
MAGPPPASCPVVIIPAYNAGTGLGGVVRDALDCGYPVLLVDDGSDDGSTVTLSSPPAGDRNLTILHRPVNGGKGAAVLTGFDHAAPRGFTHAAVFDADGQHDPADLSRLLAASAAHPEAMIMGEPTFGPDAPGLRIFGHHVADFFARLETRRADFGDSLFGLRVYPLPAARQILHAIRGGRGFDFDTQLAVRLVQAGLPFLTIPVTVRYPPSPHPSHFRYLRDNLLLIRTHARLLGRSLRCFQA